METADVVIVGAGLVGLSVAYHLTEQGVRDVALLEREPSFGQGSSGRSAGGIRLQYAHASSIRLSQYALAMFQRFEDTFGVSAGYDPCGYLFVTASEDRWRAMQEAAALQQAMGVPVETLTPDEVARRFPYVRLDGLVGGTLGLADGVADPYAVMQGWDKALRARGVRLYYGRPATGIRVAEGRISAVDTPLGPIATRVVVNAAGPYARQVGDMAGAVVPVDPYRRAVYVTGPTDALPSRMPMTLEFETTSYVRREGVSILMGMSDPNEPSSFNTHLDTATLERLVETVTRWVPALQEASVMRGWAGLYEVTPDNNPILDSADAYDGAMGPQGFFVAAGFSGHGFQHAPGAGRVLAELIVGRPPFVDLSPFRWDRFGQGSARESFVI
jgi:sarcosine oxidase subunit beta